MDYTDTPESARAFHEYCGLGEHRTLEKLADLLLQRRITEHNQDSSKRIPKKLTILSNLKKWSAKYHWQERIKEYDKTIIEKEAQERRKKLNDAIDEMNDYHAELAKGLFVKVTKRLNELLTSANDKEKLWGRDAVALFKETAALERLARGVATERIEQATTVTGDLVVKTTWGTTSLDDEDKGEQDNG